MSEESDRILPLPPQVAAQLTSSASVPSLLSVVLGLVENSLDAGAQKIDISVDFARGAASVEDNGIGIPPREFLEDGALGKSYHTSKNGCKSLVHGKNGTFLSSVAALSIMTIISHRSKHLQTATLILHHSRPAARLVPAPPHHQVSDRRHGTRVTVQDLFGNMPVRIKQRSYVSALGDDEKQLEALRKQIVGLLLAWHVPVLVTVKNNEGNTRLRIRRNGEATLDATVAKSRSQSLDLPTICSIISQYGYIEPTSWNDWTKVSARTPLMTINAAISKEPAPSKQLQFVSLGIQPIIAEMGSNTLYDEVNRLFALSSFGNFEQLQDGKVGDVRRSTDRRFKQHGYTNRQLKGAGKSVNRWPMFYIRIQLQEHELSCKDGASRLRENNLSAILKVLGAMITRFLEDNHFRPRARILGRIEARQRSSPSSKTGVVNVNGVDMKEAQREMPTENQQRDFSGWSRIKSGTPVTRPGFSRSTSAHTDEASTTKPCEPLSLDEINEEPREVEQLDSSSADTLASTEHLVSEPTIEWRNPVSGDTVKINSRTGLVADKKALKRPAIAPARAGINNASVHGKRLTRPMTSQSATLRPGSWSSEILKNWKNPVFDTTEADIPQASFDGPNVEAIDVLHGRHHCCTELDIQKAFTQSSVTFSAKLSKDALKNAEVTAQVDRKFVLIKVSQNISRLTNTGKELLVLVDQHAADERVRVEGLLANLSSPPTALTKPLVFAILSREHALLTRHAPHFADWGILYDTYVTDGSSKRTVAVKSLPAAIAERCRLEPKILIEMLRGEIWKREEDGWKPLSTPDIDTRLTGPAKDNAWLARISRCPQGLLDILNSRACRSAIMFNDVLTDGECQALIAKLAECAFPFQCAHGRPSMVPLVDLGKDSSLGDGFGAFRSRMGELKSHEISFGEAWRKWKASD
ncbi:DNA mismatch repair protein [Puttea exsequens]|nr:DNA mismatch repair protein [Puttea exsequens]